jgi:hypothetical protein
MEAEAPKEETRAGLSLTEAANELGMDANTVRYHIKRGKLKAEFGPFGGGQGPVERWRIKDEAIAEWRRLYREGEPRLPEGMEDREVSLYEAARLSGRRSDQLLVAVREGRLRARNVSPGGTENWYVVQLSELYRWMQLPGRGRKGPREFVDTEAA